MSPRPLSFDDASIVTLMDCAACLPPQKRGQFLRLVSYRCRNNPAPTADDIDTIILKLFQKVTTTDLQSAPDRQPQQQENDYAA